MQENLSLMICFLIVMLQGTLFYYYTCYYNTYPTQRINHAFLVFQGSRHRYDSEASMIADI